MRLLITILLLFTIGFTQAQDYTFTRNNCNLEIYRGAVLRENLLLNSLSWDERGARNIIEIRDGGTSFSCYDRQITNYADDQIDSLIAQLQVWKDSCISDVGFGAWEAAVVNGITPLDNKPIQLDSASYADLRIYAGDSVTHFTHTGGIIMEGFLQDGKLAGFESGTSGADGTSLINGNYVIDGSTFEIWLSGVEDGSGVYSSRLDYTDNISGRKHWFATDSTKIEFVAVDDYTSVGQRTDFYGEENRFLFRSTDQTDSTLITQRKNKIQFRTQDTVNATSLQISKTAIEVGNTIGDHVINYRITHDAPSVDGQVLEYDSADSTAKWISKVISYTPSSESDATHPVGTIAYDATYIYHKVTSVLWRRTAFGAGGW